MQIKWCCILVWCRVVVHGIHGMVHGSGELIVLRVASVEWAQWLAAQDTEADMDVTPFGVGL